MRYHRWSFLDILMAFLGVRLCHFLSFPMTDVNWGALVYTKACKYTETYSFCTKMPLRSALRVVFLARKFAEPYNFMEYQFAEFELRALHLRGGPFYKNFSL